MPKLLLAGLLLLLGAGFVPLAQAGHITVGTFSLSGMTATAAVSGENFTAGITDQDVGPFFFSGFTPFQPLIPQDFFWGGEELSSLTYNGVAYYVPGTGLPAATGQPFATVSFREVLLSPIPTVTGPGRYSMMFAVVLSLTLFDSSHTIVLTETDTGTAAGCIDYIYGNDTYVFAEPLQATITPEPSTLSLVVVAAFCFGVFLGMRNFRRRLLKP